MSGDKTDARLILLHVIEGGPQRPSLVEIGHLNVREYYPASKEELG